MYKPTFSHIWLHLKRIAVHPFLISMFPIKKWRFYHWSKIHFGKTWVHSNLNVVCQCNNPDNPKGLLDRNRLSTNKLKQVNSSVIRWCNTFETKFILLQFYQIYKNILFKFSSLLLPNFNHLFWKHLLLFRYFSMWLLFNFVIVQFFP